MNTGYAGPIMAALERRWASERDRHEAQVQGWRFFAGRGQRSGATVTPRPLRYTAFAPPRLWLLALAVVLLVGFFAYALLIDATPLGGIDALTFVALVAVVLILSVTRITVSDHGLSFDIAGVRRVSCYGFVPLSVVRDIAVGAKPADWPRARSASSWVPGGQRVHVLIADVSTTGVDREVKTLWVRDLDRFRDAVLGGPTPERRKRR
ncbi:MAG: hypothetical protein H0T85_10085 [Geodermatophilaceae bacterium]|nr:hypothetical protein [Geodermatophilaceae bacterium]